MPGRTDRGTKDIPGFAVRQQTRDLADLISHASVAGASEYYLFSEDDMRFCEHSIVALRVPDQQGRLLPVGLVCHPRLVRDERNSHAQRR